MPPDITDAGTTRPVHPGEVIRTDFMPAQHVTEDHLVIALAKPKAWVKEFLAGKHDIDADVAAGLAKAFLTPRRVWLNLQAAYDLKKGLGH